LINILIKINKNLILAILTTSNNLKLPNKGQNLTNKFQKSLIITLVQEKNILPIIIYNLKQSKKFKHQVGIMMLILIIKINF